MRADEQLVLATSREWALAHKAMEDMKRRRDGGESFAGLESSNAMLKARWRLEDAAKARDAAAAALKEPEEEPQRLPLFGSYKGGGMEVGELLKLLPQDLGRGTLSIGARDVNEFAGKFAITLAKDRGAAEGAPKVYFDVPAKHPFRSLEVKVYGGAMIATGRCKHCNEPLEAAAHSP